MDLVKLKEELLRDEGFKLTAYKDSLGNYTIGVGHLLEKDSGPITEAQCFKLLDEDIALAIVRLRRIYPAYVELSEIRQRALANMCFNLGHRLVDFVLFLAALDRKDWTEAGKQLKKSKWWAQVGARAERIRLMIV